MLATAKANASYRRTQVPLDTPPPPTSAYSPSSPSSPGGDRSEPVRVPLHKPSLAYVLKLWQQHQLPAGLYAVKHLWSWCTLLECGPAILERSMIPREWFDVRFNDLPLLVSHPHARVRNRRPLCGGCSPDELVHIWYVLQGVCPS